MSGITGMTADFFTNQEKARKKTGLLVVLFLIAVILIIASVYIAVSVALLYLQKKNVSFATGWEQQFLDPARFAYIAGGTILLVFLGSLYKIVALGKGGSSVAEMLGGRLLDQDTADPDERKLLNVVEEISIASGVTVPQVYLLEREDSINAFAAGFSPSHAVIGVTRGAIAQLSRDELQGVIAHEFSHILNGDMKLNIRLMGVLHGILLIGLTGRVMMEIILRGNRYRSRRSSKKGGGGGVIVILGLGVALFIIGYIGVFFGKLIKAAVSRQREFLADSAAVQFTRNPGGLAGALKKIGGLFAGSRLSSPRAEEASHIFFGNALSPKSFTGLLATHPPLDRRIIAIDPRWDGEFTAPTPKKEEPPKEEIKQAPPLQWIPGIGKQGAGPATAGGNLAIDPGNIVKSIGILTPAMIIHASALLSSLPTDVRSAVRTPEKARAVIFAMLMNREPEPRKKQWDYLGEAVGSSIQKILQEILPRVESLGNQAFLALLDLAMPTLRSLKEEECRTFLKHVQELIQADEKVTLFEFVLVKILRKNLEPVIRGKVDKAPIQYYSVTPLAADISVLLSALTHAGYETDDKKKEAFAAGVGKMRMRSGSLTLSGEDAIDFDRLDDALDRLRKAAPGVKRRIMNALAYVAAFDKTVTVDEGVLLRAIADTLDCPVPPLVAAR